MLFDTYYLTGMTHNSQQTCYVSTTDCGIACYNQNDTDVLQVSYPLSAARELKMFLC